MAFEGLGEKLQETFKKLRGKGKLGEKDIKEAMREVKLALLEADVNFKVVKKFVKNVSEKCVGSEVLESLTPAQQVIKIVNDELTTLMGGSKSEIDFSGVGPTVIMMAGLQGAGKTTMTGKLALQLRKNYNKRPLLVACDIYRPAAIKQLEIVGKQIDVPVFQMGDKVSPVEIAKEGIKYARENSLNVVIIDTAGRLHIDEELMTELKDVKVAVDPNEILLVVDSMTGQDAVNVAKSIDKLERKYKAEFKDKFKTITFDNGGEFRDYKALEKSYDRRKKEARIQVYYAHPYRSGERGSNENANRLIRRFIPKGTVITNIFIYISYIF